MAKKRDNSTMRILKVLTFCIGVLWAGSLILNMVNPSYNPPQTIGLAFMAVLSTMLGIIAAANGKRDSGDDDEDDEEK